MTTPAFPPGRYGRRRSARRAPRWVLPVLVAAVVVAGVAVAFGMYRTYVSGQIQSEVTAFSIRSDHEVTVTFSVIKDAGEAVTCIVRARSKDGQEVGRAEVGVPKQPRSASVTYALPTSKRAFTGEVYSCSPSDG